MSLPMEQSQVLADVTQEMIAILRTESGVANLTPESALQDGGLDSLRVMSLVLKIETRYDIELDADDAGELRTIDDLARLVVRCIEKRQ